MGKVSRKEIGFQYFENKTTRYAGYRISLSKVGKEYFVEREYGRLGKKFRKCHHDPAYKGRDYDGALAHFKYESNSRFANGYKLINEKKCPRKDYSKPIIKRANIASQVPRREKLENKWQKQFEDRYPEGAERRLIQTTRERNPTLTRNAVIKYGTTCKVCDFDFNKYYGRSFGQSYIEVHHVIPLASVRAACKTNIKDVIVVCSNCHRVIHRKRNSSIDWRKLRSMVIKYRNKPV